MKKVVPKGYKPKRRADTAIVQRLMPTVALPEESNTDRSVMRWSAAAEKIDAIRDSAVARVSKSAPLSWWQVSTTYWAMLFSALAVNDVVSGHYVWAVFAGCLAAFDIATSARAVKASKSLAVEPTLEALEAADAEATRVLEAAEKYDAEDEYAHLLPPPKTPAPTHKPDPTEPEPPPPPWGPGSRPHMEYQVPELQTQVRAAAPAQPQPQPRLDQSDAAFWRFVNSTPNPKTVSAPTRTPGSASAYERGKAIAELTRLTEASRQEERENNRKALHNSSTKTPGLLAYSNKRFLELLGAQKAILDDNYDNFYLEESLKALDKEINIIREDFNRMSSRMVF